MAKQVDALYGRSSGEEENDPDFLYLVQDTHTRFHLLICRSERLRGLCAPCSKRNQVLTFKSWLYYVAARRPPLPPRFHVDLAEALCAGNEEAADRAMRAHVRYGLEHIIFTASCSEC